jgi:uncharacterized protein
MERFCAAAACLLLAFAAYGQGPVRSLLELRTEGVIVQQWDTSCGAAALATVLTFTFDDPVSEEAAARAMLRRTSPLRVRARGGFSLLDLKRFAEGRGYVAEGYRGLDLDQLVRLRSPIVPINEWGNAHFVVVRGLRDGRVDIADPGFGNRLLPVEQFLELWQHGIGFAIRRASP